METVFALLAVMPQIISGFITLGSLGVALYKHLKGRKFEKSADDLWDIAKGSIVVVEAMPDGFQKDELKRKYAEVMAENGKGPLFHKAVKAVGKALDGSDFIQNLGDQSDVRRGAVLVDNLRREEALK